MKSLLLTVAVLFLTGTLSCFPWQHEEPQKLLHHAREVIESCLNKIRDIGREAVSQAESSAIAKQFDLKITESFDNFSSNALALKKQLHTYVGKVKEEVTAELKKDIPLLKEKIRPYVETFQKNWGAEVKSFKEKVEPLVDQLKKQTKENLEGFFKNAESQLEELKARLHTEVNLLRVNIVPYMEELKQKLVEKFEEVKANAAPKAEEFKAQLAQHAEALKQRLRPVIENLKDQLVPKIEEAKTRLAQLCL